jgi:hypothetical protein
MSGFKQERAGEGMGISLHQRLRALFLVRQKVMT